MPESTTIRLALAGDTMLGRSVVQALRTATPRDLFSDELSEITRGADLFLLNLECCISERGERWRDPLKPFFFRAPPSATEVLRHLGVDCVTLANNHALDYGPVALVDTLRALDEAGIRHVGAGEDIGEARRPVVLETDGYELEVRAFTDHPRDFAATPDSPGVAYANLRTGVPDWILDGLDDGVRPVLVTPHWGPNMIDAPLSYVREAAAVLIERGVTLVAGHSAHVFQGVAGRVLYDLGDFIDDYAVDATLRNDLGLLFVIDLGSHGPERLEAVPLKLEFCHTGLVEGEEAGWIMRRFIRSCAALGTEVDIVDGRLVVEFGERGR